MSNKKIIKFKQPAEFYYRMTEKLMDQGKYINALSSIRKAVDMEPEDYDYALYKAEILTELGKYEQSNRVLFELMEWRDNVGAECFFCLGCNFMGLNDIAKAQQSFEKYMEIQPDGEYKEEVEDFLYYFEEDDLESLLQDALEEDPIFGGWYKKAREGKEHLDRGEYQQAVDVLEQIDNSSGEMSYAKNNLALAYYCLDDIKKALEVSRAVLALDKNNLHANCNMAVFLYELGGYDQVDQYVNTALENKTSAPDDLYKVAITLCETKKHEQAIGYLEEYTQSFPYDEKALFYLAAAHYNSGKYKRAIYLLDHVRKLDDPGVIAGYYLQRIHKVLADPNTFVEMDYVYQVPPEEAKKKIKYLNRCLTLEDGEFLKLWDKDDTFMDTILWGLEYGDGNIKRAIAGMVAGFADQKSERMLRDFIFQKEQPDDVKNDIFMLLSRMNAKEPYIAYINHEVVEVKVDEYDFGKEDLSEAYTKLFQLLYKIIDMYYDDEVLTNTLEVIEDYLQVPEEMALQYKTNHVAAGILYLALKQSDQSASLDDVCSRFHADKTEVYTVIEMLQRADSSGMLHS